MRIDWLCVIIPAHAISYQRHATRVVVDKQVPNTHQYYCSATMAGENTWDANLFNSSLRGDIEGVTSALAHGGRVTIRGPQGATPNT